MSYLVLARKYRPQTFEDVVKQEHVTRTLSNAIVSGRVAHAILFSGPRGTGKTTVARILAKAMNCKQGPTPLPCNICRSCKEITAGSSPDVFEIDGASNNGVDHIRELRENIRYMPAYSPYKIYIIDEVHMLSTQAFNALLKTLEEPPSHIMFLFATTEPHKIPITILSRCQRHDLRRIDMESITGHMALLCNKEGVDIQKESLALIARESGGSMRDALSLLDQVITCSQDNMTHEHILDILGVIDRKFLFDISAAVLQGDMGRILELIADIYDHGHNLKELYTSLLEHFRNLMVAKMGNQAAGLIDLPSHEIRLMAEQVKNVSGLFLNQILDALFKEETIIKFSTQPRLALEMAFIRIFQIKPALPIEQLIEKIDNLSKGVSLEFVSAFPAPMPGQSMLREGKSYETNRCELSEPPLENKPESAIIKFDQNDSDDEIWEKLKKLITSESSSLGSYLNKADFKRLNNDRLEIQANDSSFNFKQISKKEDLIKDICEKFFGKKITLLIIPEKTGNNKKIETKTQAEQKKQDALNHPITQAALEIFNGKLVEVKILQEV
ncbi:DNA polymerase III, subunit gamma/tau [Desulfonema limicola]|uniref:DNA polymerase III subunit gamma/tau n=1 Tax=Desulfonema limicola TaxID=45656 RepID=A0A975BDH0_9BACT|nr:DNA polymerase III subunit gamma/tau [Desulfonema limicola]QTA83185.1 DNA polymerase III, subunit gamma/tau [Desulfonema limicola]